MKTIDIELTIILIVFAIILLTANFIYDLIVSQINKSKCKHQFKELPEIYIDDIKCIHCDKSIQEINNNQNKQS